ncbi:protein FAM214A [Caerostris extrusa]|uniref:Protein FAM214A n=1 Tax=Caerostris extrusa TaxID=172846 RepID=A0AAV4X9R1_CAEEX|nr:protein FAM214A [Caerostris extrusa]
MTEVYEENIATPCSESVLQTLYIDLCNLIVESRIPHFNDRGYGDGIHCPPLLGRSTHLCDLSKSEFLEFKYPILIAKKHQRLVHHSLRALGNNVFEIEVLILPDCCTDSKLKERIQKKEYILLEKWSLKCINCKLQPTLDVPQLLRAVRSFLHFSQLSAWLSSTQGKSPSNIYYWVKSSVEGLSTKFEQEPEVHSFPICKIGEDLFGSVQVQYPARTQYIPIIPCWRHPPPHGYSFRDNTGSSLNPQIVRQLQKASCDDQHDEKSYVPESTKLLLTQTTLLKTFNNVSNLSFDLNQEKNIDMVSKSQTSYVCNYAKTFNNDFIQENVCFNNNKVIRHLRKNKLMLKNLNVDTSPSLAIPLSVDTSQNFSGSIKHSLECDDADSPSKSQLNNISNNNLVLKSFETGSVKETPYHLYQQKGKERSYKQKVNGKATFPKKLGCDKQQSLCPVNINESLSQQNVESSQARYSSSVNINLSHTDSILEACTDTFQHESKTLKTTSSEKRGLYLSSIQTYSKRKRAKIKKCEQIISDNYNRQVIDSKLNNSKAICCNNTEIRSSEDTSAADSGKRNKKLKLTNDNLREASPLPSLRFSDSNEYSKNVCSENKYFCRKQLLNCRKSNSSSYRNSDNPTCKLIHEKNLPEPSNNIKNCGSFSNKTELKKNLIFQRNKFQNSLSTNTILNSKYYHEGLPKNNLILHKTKLLRKYKRIFIEKRKRYVVENNLRDIQVLGYICKETGRELPNSSGCVLQDKNCNYLYKNAKNIKTVLKNRKEETSMAFCESKETSEINDKFISSQSYVISNTTIASSENCQLQFSLPEFIDLKQASRTSVGTNQQVSTSNVVVEKLSNGIDENPKNTVLELEKVNLQNDKQSPYVLSNLLPVNKRNIQCRNSLENLDHFPISLSKFPKGRKLLTNFEESILKGCLPTVNRTTPYVAHVSLGDAEYYLPRKGAVQVTLFNPSETVVKMFVLNYDLSSMPPMCHTFIRQKIYYLPVGSTDEYPKSQKWLRFIIHLRFASSKTGKVFLHEDFKILVLNKSSDDAASEFSQEPRELRSFISVPKNPTFSNI